MALNRQPATATAPITRIPEEIPSAKNSAWIRPLKASTKPTQPIAVSTFPTGISRQLIYFFAVITLYPG